ncbi:MAG: hypothetical protein V3V60_15785 [Sphingomonas aquatilis]|uniref:hypothetical protein n=1 Tax=Sphingomonas aquatilis TaxID=93063 RepID=UPI002F334DE6
MDIPSHAEVVAQVDAFLRRQKMTASRLGRDAFGEPQFVNELREGRMPGLARLLKLSAFMRQRDEALIMKREGNDRTPAVHRLNAGGR